MKNETIVNGIVLTRAQVESAIKDLNTSERWIPGYGERFRFGFNTVPSSGIYQRVGKQAEEVFLKGKGLHSHLKFVAIVCNEILDITWFNVEVGTFFPVI